MKPKKYKPLFWNHLTSEEREPYQHWIETKDVEGNMKAYAVYCTVCKIRVCKSVTTRYYSRYLTMSDQRHNDSKKHRCNVTMAKLANES